MRNIKTYHEALKQFRIDVIKNILHEIYFYEEYNGQPLYTEIYPTI